MDDILILIGAVGAGSGYIYFQRRLDSYVLPMRLHMAELGEQLAAETHLPATVRNGISDELGMAFSCWPMIACVFLIPVAFLQLALRHKPKPENISRAAAADLRRYRNMLFISWAAANPICALVAALEVILFIPLLVICDLTAESVVAVTLEATDSITQFGRKMHRV
jgi:hypothetical protein